MSASIAGLGLWLPPNIRTNEDYPSAFVEAARSRAANALVDLTESEETEADRIASRLAADEQGDPFLASRTRHVADPGLRAHQAEVYAARLALEDSGISARELDAVLVYSVCPDKPQPTGAHKVAHALGATRAWAMGVDQGCASSVAGLEVASALIDAGRARHVLLVQSNLMTRVVPLMHPVSPTVGDGVSALVVSASDEAGILAVRTISHGDHYESICYVRGTDDATDVPWYQGGGPFVMGSRDPERMRNLIRQTVAFGEASVRSAAEAASIAVRDIDVLCVTHPRNFIPYAVAEALGLSRDRVPNAFTRYAHLGACSVLANLHLARETGTLRPGSTVALYSQGYGFVRSAAIVRWNPRRA